MAVRPYKRNGVIDPKRWMIDYYDAKGQRQRAVYELSRAARTVADIELTLKKTPAPFRRLSG